jgi:hypothetical protein
VKFRFDRETEAKIDRIMFETRMDRMQAIRHLQDRESLSGSHDLRYQELFKRHQALLIEYNRIFKAYETLAETIRAESLV